MKPSILIVVAVVVAISAVPCTAEVIFPSAFSVPDGNCKCRVPIDANTYVRLFKQLATAAKHAAAGEFKQEQESRREAVGICEKHFGPEHWLTRAQEGYLAAVTAILELDSAGQSEIAKAHTAMKEGIAEKGGAQNYRAAERIYREQLGAESILTLEANYYTFFAKPAIRNPAAYASAIDALAAKLTKEHPAVLRLMAMHGFVLFEANDPEARNVLERFVETSHQAGRRQESGYAPAQGMLAKLYNDAGESEKALAAADASVFAAILRGGDRSAFVPAYAEIARFQLDHDQVDSAMTTVMAGFDKANAPLTQAKLSLLRSFVAAAERRGLEDEAIRTRAVVEKMQAILSAAKITGTRE